MQQFLWIKNKFHWSNLRPEIVDCCLIISNQYCQEDFVLKIELNFEGLRMSKFDLLETSTPTPRLQNSTSKINWHFLQETETQSGWADRIKAHFGQWKQLKNSSKIKSKQKCFTKIYKWFWEARTQIITSWNPDNSEVNIENIWKMEVLCH